MMVIDMKRYLLSIILCLWASCAWAFPPGFIAMAASEVDAPPSGKTDSFTGTDGTALATHDSSWAAMSSAGVSSAVISGNAVTISGVYNDIRARYTTSTADVSQVTSKAFSNTASNTRKTVHVRSGATTDGYSFFLDTLSGGNFTGLEFDKGASYLGSCGGLSIPAGSDHVLKITASGTNTVTLTAYVNGTQVCQTTDSSSTITSGNPGFGVLGNGVAGNNFIDTWSDH